MVSLRGSCRSARAAVDAVRAHRAEHDRCVQRQKLGADKEALVLRER